VHDSQRIELLPIFAASRERSAREQLVEETEDDSRAYVDRGRFTDDPDADGVRCQSGRSFH
jgi:hypothetical protein